MGRFSIDDKKMLASLDLGTSHIKCTIASIDQGCLELCGLAKVAHRGLCRGHIVNMKETSHAIRLAFNEAEAMAGKQVTQLILGFGGEYSVFSSQGMAIIPSGQVTTEDVFKSIETARAVPLSNGHRLVHVLPKSFTVDAMGPFVNPLGLSGLRLQTEALIISVAENNIQNIFQCLRYVGYSAKTLVVQSLAATLSILNEEEKKSGTCVLDMGQDQSSLALVANYRVQHLSVLPMGGEDFTHDLMENLKISRDLAETIKIKYGKILPLNFLKPSSSVYDSTYTEENIPELESLGILVNQKKINEILSLRAEMLFRTLRDTLQNYGNGALAGGLVLTGGASRLKGLSEMGRSLIEKPVKNGVMHVVPGLKDLKNKDDYVVAIGMLYYIQNESTLDYAKGQEGKMFKIKKWMQDLMP